MAQALSSDGSCRAVVNDARVKRLIAGLPECSSNTAGYCKARARLPQTMISTLALRAGGLVADGVCDAWLWRGRRVLLADGTTTTLPDIEENQAVYPQPASQREGLGFPIMRLVVLLCLASGALLDAAEGACKGKGGDEQTLFRGLLGTLRHGDVLLGDAYFPTYFLLCALAGLGVDGVFEQYGARRRSTDFRLGKRLGSKDHLIVWTKPKRPDWMSPQQYAEVPDTLTVRELNVGGKTLVTTFLCPKDTPKRVLKALYWRRWNVELDVRNIKTTLGMETLRCRTPEMARKELWAYLLAYNLIRLLMAQAALLADQVPRQLSFKQTVQVWISWHARGGASHDGAAIHGLLLLIAEPRVGLRPGRIEPRRRKRRPKSFPLMTKPRAEAREEVRLNGHPKKQR
ncbi:MAG: IS4 family transposase [Thiohalocapsa sp. PB-PSB1]|jgi:hypothetical protein|nr:MAG: hypothetical protein N838_28965 [Thiohalocapsa sp. PB-PSB1]QQO52476.1 MAG: IS4 family transposase [Thiohalocapsa sp. PB-PSB1]